MFGGFVCRPAFAYANEAVAASDDMVTIQQLSISLDSNDILMLAIFGGAMSFALLSAFWLIRERARMVSTNQKLKQSLANLRALNDRNEALVSTTDERIVVWNGTEDQAIVLGSLPASSGAPDDNSQFMRFAHWLDTDFSNSFENHVRELRINATGF
ncbi:MAG: hypothetical protein AAF423_06355, partial [Pseudomonadota bacterium]